MNKGNLPSYTVCFLQHFYYSQGHSSGNKQRARPSRSGAGSGWPPCDSGLLEPREQGPGPGCCLQGGPWGKLLSLRLFSGFSLSSSLRQIPLHSSMAPTTPSPSAHYPPRVPLPGGSLGVPHLPSRLPGLCEKCLLSTGLSPQDQSGLKRVKTRFPAWHDMRCSPVKPHKGPAC